MPFILLTIGILSILSVAIDFLYWLTSGKRMYYSGLTKFLELIVLAAFPLVYLAMVDEPINNCCSDSAAFAPGHKLTIYVLVGICIAAFFYSSYRKKIASPILEVITNAILVFGFVFNIFVGLHAGEFYWWIGNVPIGMLFIFQIADNHKKFIEFKLSSSNLPDKSLERFAWIVLTKSPLAKYPLLFLLFFPLFFLITSLLLLFGQKPDSIVSAFTDTYKHGFSQLDYMCDNVMCGGHFLCSVAANGHKTIVNPIRYGERNGSKIICNRQLLIANAFEEIVEQNFPRAHRMIRGQYNKVGNSIHRHYHIFNNKFIADSIYFLMKPMEFIFLLVIYTCDNKPENRIAMQYLKRSDRKALREKRAI
jgi:hypothetical protein